MCASGMQLSYTKKPEERNFRGVIALEVHFGTLPLWLFLGLIYTLLTIVTPPGGNLLGH